MMGDVQRLVLSHHPLSMLATSCSWSGPWLYGSHHMWNLHPPSLPASVSDVRQCQSHGKNFLLLTPLGHTKAV
uniref:Uncharacterized protein n=1 Tax=Felis catus TaxID=9685 RepID=A0ABI7YQW9_FELCA